MAKLGKYRLDQRLQMVLPQPVLERLLVLERLRLLLLQQLVLERLRLLLLQLVLPQPVLERLRLLLTARLLVLPQLVLRQEPRRVPVSASSLPLMGTAGLESGVGMVITTLADSTRSTRLLGSR